MNTMLVRYKTIYKLSGVNKLPNGIDDVETFV